MDIGSKACPVVSQCRDVGQGIVQGAFGSSALNAGVLTCGGFACGKGIYGVGKISSSCSSLRFSSAQVIKGGTFLGVTKSMKATYQQSRNQSSDSMSRINSVLLPSEMPTLIKD